jgi:hypothetical protein
MCSLCANPYCQCPAVHHLSTRHIRPTMANPMLGQATVRTPSGVDNVGEFGQNAGTGRPTRTGASRIAPGPD